MTTRRPQPTTPPQPAASPSPWTPDTADRITAAVVGVDAAWREAERHWGVGRLAVLVSDATRLAMRGGMLRWQAAISAADATQVEALSPLITAALAWMHREATKAGAQPLSPAVWEVQRADGTVVAICRTGPEASAVSHDGRNLEVWTLDEVARVLPRPAGDIKRAFPGAKVTRVTQRDEGEAQARITQGSNAPSAKADGFLCG